MEEIYYIEWFRREYIISQWNGMELIQLESGDNRHKIIEQVLSNQIPEYMKVHKFENEFYKIIITKHNVHS